MKSDYKGIKTAQKLEDDKKKSNIDGIQVYFPRSQKSST